MIAAKIIADVTNKKDVLIVSSKIYAQRAILKYATYTDSITSVENGHPVFLPTRSPKSSKSQDSSSFAIQELTIKP